MPTDGTMLTKQFMENKAERIETITSPELKGLLVELKAVDTEITEMVSKSEEAQKLFDAKITVRQKIVDSMKPVVEEVFTGKLGEFEVLANITLPEVDAGDSVEVKIVDEVEKFKEGKRKAKDVDYAKPLSDSLEENIVVDLKDLD